ncbi:MAG TPA: ABC transporter substrate-binding protein, partial [Streptosporangiaceae bacterium]
MGTPPALAGPGPPRFTPTRSRRHHCKSRALWLVDADRRTARQVTGDDIAVWEAGWAGPDRVVAVTSADRTDSGWYSARLSLVDTETGKCETLLTSDVQLGLPAGSPAGKHVAVVSAVSSDRGMTVGDLLLLDGRGGGRRLATCGADVSYLRWLDATRLSFAGLRGLDSVVGIVDVTTGEATELWCSPEALGGMVQPDAVVPDVAADCRRRRTAESPRMGGSTPSTSAPGYQITSYVPGKSITLSRNPAWKQASDPLRHQYVNKITVTMGIGSSQAQIADLQANTADLGLGDLQVPPTSIPAMLASHDQRLHIWPNSALNPYLWFNLRSPDSGGAMGKLLVRQAVEYGVNKAALQKVLGGPSINKIVSTAIPPGNLGYKPYNPYPTPGN